MIGIDEVHELVIRDIKIKMQTGEFWQEWEDDDNLYEMALKTMYMDKAHWLEKGVILGEACPPLLINR